MIGLIRCKTNVFHNLSVNPVFLKGEERAYKHHTTLDIVKKILFITYLSLVNMFHLISLRVRENYNKKFYCVNDKL